MNVQNAGLRTLHRRVTLALAARELAAVSAVCLFAIGSALLIARAGFGVEPAGLISTPFGGPAVIICTFLLIGTVAALRTIANRPDSAALAACADAQLQAGGALMHPGAEAPVVPTTGLRVRTEWRTVAGLLAAGGVFALAAGLAPLPNGGAGDTVLAIQQNIDDLAEDAETLTEVGVIEEDEREAFDDALDEVFENADATRPGQTWEALDRLADELARDAAAGIELAREAATAAGALEEMAAAMTETSGSPPAGMAEALASAIPELEALVASGVLDPELLETLRQAAAEGLTPEERQAAAEAARERAEAAGLAQGDLAAALARAGLASMADAAAVAMARAAAREALRDYLRQCESGMCVLDAECLVAVCFGSGAVTRGPGATQMAFHDTAADLDDAGLSPERLDGAIDPSGSTVAGLSRTAQAGESGGASAGGAINAANAGVSFAIETRHLPRHRDAIRAFFARADRPGPSDSSDQPAGNTSGDPADDDTP